jgi:hypothetical protein
MTGLYFILWNTQLKHMLICQKLRVFVLILRGVFPFIEGGQDSTFIKPLKNLESYKKLM